MNTKPKKLNVFSKEYFLYPDEMRRREEEQQRKLLEEQNAKAIEMRSKRAQIEFLENMNKVRIEDALKAIDFDLNSLPVNPDWLPLHAFYNTKYDCLSPDHWINMYKDENGNELPFRGVMLEVHNQRYLWTPIKVIGYDSVKDKWIVETYTKEINQQLSVSRLLIVFDAEDKNVAALKIAESFTDRILTDSYIRYCFYIDAMPTNDLTPPKPTSISRIAALSKKLKVLDKNESTRDGFIKSEVTSFFYRSMNKIIFDHYLDKGKPLLSLSEPLVMSKEEKTERTEVGIFPLSCNHFSFKSTEDNCLYPATMMLPEIFKLFCLHSMFIKPSVVKLMSDVSRLNKVTYDMLLFPRLLESPANLEAFRSYFESFISKFMSQTKINWTKSLVLSIESHLQEETSGWFNLHTINPKNYKFGKLNALLRSIDLKMADTLKQTIVKNFNSYYSQLEERAPLETKVVSEKEALNIYKDPSKKKNSLFILRAKIEDNLVTFFDTPEKFRRVLISFFESSLADLGRIARVEATIVRGIHELGIPTSLPCPTLVVCNSITETPSQSSTPILNPNQWLLNIHAKLLNLMERVTKPVEDYLLFYEEINNQINTWFKVFLNKIETDKSKLSVQDLLERLENQKSALNKIRERLPMSIDVSWFHIDNEEVFLFLSEIESQVETEVLKLVEEMGRVQLNNSLKELKGIKMRMKERPTTVEEQAVLEEYINGQMKTELESVKNSVISIREIYAILESKKIKLIQEDQKKLWQLIGGPKEVINAKTEMENDFEASRKILYKEMTAEQMKFDLEVESLHSTVDSFERYQNPIDWKDVFQQGQDLNDRISKLVEKAAVYNRREVLLGKKITDYSELKTLVKNFAPLFNFWRIVTDWETGRDGWMNDSWENINLKSAKVFNEECLSVLSTTSSFLNNKNSKSFQRLIKGIERLKSEFLEFANRAPILFALKEPGMQPRHWEAISHKLGRDSAISPTKMHDLTLSKLLILGIEANAKFCIDVGERANKEFQIQTSLAKMKDKWKTIEVVTKPHKRPDYFLVASFEKVESELDEDFAITSALILNPFKAPFASEVDSWNDTLMTMSNLIEDWRQLQFQWNYLQPIFDSGDIARQLPAESTIFKKIDQFYKGFILNVRQSKSLLTVVENTEMITQVKESNIELEQIQKELNNYLEVKRSRFARFYFISNDELLSILSETKEVENVQRHLRKVFENIGRLEFTERKQIAAMLSVEGERVAFETLINPIGRQVEDWMRDVEDSMKSSVKKSLAVTVKDFYNSKIMDWIVSHSGQCVLNGWQVFWTNLIEEAIKSKRLVEVLRGLNESLLTIVRTDRAHLLPQTLITMEALIVIEVHSLDVVEKLAQQEISDIEAFEWISQLRYYLLENQDCEVKCIQTVFPYGNEYLGNTSRLVITPLTDKCYMTLMGALRLNLGGAPAGPAGTGKTETTKDLAKALAKQCVVFNCQESMDYLFLAKFFKGLAVAGAWCCFDEFNRINIEVLSVIAQQLQELFRGKAEKVREMRFEDSLIKLDPTFSVFITMNPGYAGRTELPDNLKALFRSVAMMVPDYALIAQIKLYSFGFVKAKELSRKMVDTFRLSSEQLSNQKHYDYGMRAVTSVINAAGLFKSRFKDGQMDEENLLYKALIDVNLPKFLSQDIPLFNNILKDLFPALVVKQIVDANLIAAIKHSCEAIGLVPEESFVAKILQLYDTFRVRHGLMLVGPSGSGKSSNYKILQMALNKLSKEGQDIPVEVKLINPKAMTLFELYGESRDLNWNEGVIEMVMENAITESSDAYQWIMFDGPVDAVWIESMNTVLDDNKKLCLSSGKVLILTNRMTMMFEVEDLKVASPATVSRCGMVFMDQNCLNPLSYLKNYLHGLPEALNSSTDFKEELLSLTEQSLLAVYKKVDKREMIMEVNWSTIIGGFCAIVDAVLKELDTESIKDTLQSLRKNLKDLVLFAAYWSLGCLGESEFRERVLSQLSGALKTEHLGNIADRRLNSKNMEWASWSTLLDNQASQSQSGEEIVVPTSEFIRNLGMNLMLLSNKKPVLNPGSVGSGKTLLMNQIFSKYLSKDFNTASYSLSARTTPQQLSDFIFSQIDKRRKGVFGPPNLRKCVVHLDDVNMPMKEVWGAQPSIEILRQLLDQKAWHVIKHGKEYLQLEDIIFAGSMVPPRAGRNEVSARFTRHFFVLPFLEFDTQTLKTIYQSILQKSFEKSNLGELKEEVVLLVEGAIDVFKAVQRTLLPTPSKSHYLFNIRDLAKVISGICLFNSSNNQRSEVWNLWQYECIGSFGDRLADSNDIAKLQTIVKDVLKHKSDLETVSDLVYSSVPNGVYRKLESIDKIIALMTEGLAKYNAECQPKNRMNLVMFSEASLIVSRLFRILQTPQGHVLLMGVGGSGRQSLSKLAVYMSGLHSFSIEVGRGYNISKWGEDLKKLILSSIVDNKTTGFIISDNQLISDQFVEDVNTLISTGNLIGLPFNPEEAKKLDEVGRLECAKKQMQATKLNIISCQTSLIRRNLHFLLAMSPSDARFASRLRMFPALVNCCSLIWMHKWSGEALLGVGQNYLAQNMSSLDDSTIIASIFRDIHLFNDTQASDFRSKTRRSNFLTPSSYLDLLSTFKKVHVFKNKELTEQSMRFESGVRRMAEANDQVEAIRVSLREEEPKLKQAEIDVKELLDKVDKDRATENQTRKVVALQESEASKQQQEANILKKEAEESVRIANEELERTLEKIQLLKPANIIEVRSATNPVRKVKLVMAGLCYLLLDINILPGLLKKSMTEDELWPVAKSNLLSDPNKLFNTLMSSDTKDNIDSLRLSKVRDLARANTEVWNEKEMKSSSLANYFIFLWVDCILNYTDISEKTKPIREELAKVTKLLEEKTAFLNQKKIELAASTQRLKELEALYAEKIAFKEDLFKRIENSNQRVERASKLTLLLKDEGLRWEAEIVNYGKKIALEVYDSIIIACKMNYFGPYILSYRQSLASKIESLMLQNSLPTSSVVSLPSFLSTPLELLNWNIKGLPKDETSADNGVLLLKTERCPLIIDPQLKGTRFLKALGKDHSYGVDVIKASANNLLRQLEQAVQIGKWVLIEGVEQTLDPSLEPLLLKKIFFVDNTMTIALGDKSIPISEHFRLFLSTSLQNPQFSPEVFSKVLVINFCISRFGLEEHLLAQVMSSENQELETKRSEIVISNSNDQQKLADVESGILIALQEAEGDILSDDFLIIKLAESKKTAAEISQRLAEAKITEKEIEEIREEFRDVAFFASFLFFLVSDLPIIDPMYQYSLQWFEHLFSQSLQRSAPSSESAERSLLIKNFFLSSLFDRITQSIYSKQKPIFSFLLASRCLQEYRQLDLDKYHHLISSVQKTEETEESICPVNWIPQNTWTKIVSELKVLTRFDSLKNFHFNFTTRPNDWKNYFESNEPQNFQLPSPWEDTLSEIDRLLVLKTLRLEKLLPGLERFVIKSLGQKFVEYPTPLLADIFASSSCTLPILFMIAPGSDPKSDFDSLVNTLGIKNVHVISLGQGQGDKAEKMIKETSKLNGDGGWIFLQNCHLSLSWLQRLEQLCEDLSVETTHPNFRLWLTTMPFASFPPFLLQNSIKLTIEPPRGLKANLQLIYNGLDSKSLEACTKRPTDYKKLLFGLSVFHAIVQERRLYGAIGWNIPYEFTAEDFSVCKRQLLSFLEEQDIIPFKVLNFVFAEINYGGRVTDDKDIRLINSICRSLICEKILDDKFCFDANGVYKSLPKGSQVDYLNHIAAFPNATDPQILGLHRNSEILTNQNASIDTLNMLVSISMTSSSKGDNKDEIKVLEIIQIIEEGLPVALDLDVLNLSFPVMYEESLNTVVIQEVEKYCNLLLIVKKSLSDLKLAISGVIVMNSDLESIFNELLAFKVPVKWSDTFLSLKPILSWVKEFSNRVKFFENWWINKKPKAFWLNAFCFPQAFITGVLQNFARKKKLAIDSLSFEFEVSDYFREDDPNISSPEDGVYVYGLIIEGSKWRPKERIIDEPVPNELYSQLPLVLFLPTDSKKVYADRYKAPLYKTLSRSGTLTTTGHSSNFVMYVELPSQKDTEHWIKAGVACFLALKD